jgi:hypothetical protein
VYLLYFHFFEDVTVFVVMIDVALAVVDTFDAIVTTDDLTATAGITGTATLLTFPACLRVFALAFT